MRASGYGQVFANAKSNEVIRNETGVMTATNNIQTITNN
jgi:hypothetical protein